MAFQHYRNLSRGNLCGCLAPNARPIRIQSTACEQKLWGNVLTTLGADMLYELANGTSCIVHDRSERDRETRACWQGLSWIRYACAREWRGKAPDEFGRGGMNITGYWEEQFRLLPEATHRMLKFYGQYYKGGVVDLYSCYIPAPAAPSQGAITSMESIDVCAKGAHILPFNAPQSGAEVQVPAALQLIA